jgi:hypothetical protein
MKENTVGHKSFSQFSTWVRCGKAYELERIQQAPTEPAWWFVGGTAFHTAVEKFLLRQLEVRNQRDDVPF